MLGHKKFGLEHEVLCWSRKKTFHPFGTPYTSSFNQSQHDLIMVIRSSWSIAYIWRFDFVLEHKIFVLEQKNKVSTPLVHHSFASMKKSRADTGGKHLPMNCEGVRIGRSFLNFPQAVQHIRMQKSLFDWYCSFIQAMMISKSYQLLSNLPKNK